jgi:hypothetical protein
LEPDPGIELTEDLFEPGAATDSRLPARDELNRRPPPDREQGSGEVTVADVFLQSGANLSGDQTGGGEIAGESLRR